MISFFRSQFKIKLQELCETHHNNYETSSYIFVRIQEKKKTIICMTYIIDGCKVIYKNA